MKYYLFAVSFFLFLGCSKTLPQIHNDEPRSLGVQNTIERANNLASISFVPLCDLKYNTGFYNKGIRTYGAPYSSVKETQTFIGQDISFYTFLTAIENPFSLLYTEKIDRSPYSGINCKLYYGVVCSSAVMYALGIQIPYPTHLLNDSGLFIKSKYQSPDDVNLCSILLEPGHVSMVVGINRDNRSKITSVSVFEATQGGTFIHEFSYSDFCKRWTNNNITHYEYKYIDQNTTLIDFTQDAFILNNKLLNLNFELSLNKGDKSTYAVDEDVIINILNNDYKTIELYLYDEIISVNEICSKAEIIYSNLSPGEYAVRLRNDDKFSHFVFFEIIDTETEIFYDYDNIIVVPKSKNAVPVFVSLNSISISSYRKIYPFKEMVGSIIIPYPKEKDLPMYIRIVYKGKYGRVKYQTILNVK